MSNPLPKTKRERDEARDALEELVGQVEGWLNNPPDSEDTIRRAGGLALSLAHARRVLGRAAA